MSNGETAPRQIALDRVAQLVPVLSILGVTGAVFHTVVYLEFAGALALAPLTLSDVLSKTWAVTPYFVISAFLATGIWPIFGLASRARRASERPSKPPSGFGPASSFLAFIAIFVVPITIYVLHLEGVLIKHPWLILAGYVSHAAGLIFVFNKVAPTNITGLHFQVAWIIGYNSFALLTMFAMLSGMSAITTDQNVLLRYGDGHLFCGKLITIGERGVVVYEPTSKSHKLIKSDAVKSIEDPSPCKPARRWSAPQKEAKKPAAPKT